MFLCLLHCFFVFVFFPLTDVGAKNVYSQKENLVLIILEN